MILRRLARRLRQFRTRILLGNILVATLASVIGVLILVVILINAIQGVSATDYRSTAMVGVLEWLIGQPSGLPNAFGYPPGYTVIVSSDNKILYSQGDTTCKVDMALAECATELLDGAPGERFFDRNGQRWAEVIIPLIDGNRVLTRRGPPNAELALLIPGAPVKGTLPFLIVVALAMAILSIPVSFVLTWAITRPMTRRLLHLAQTSRRFAAGEFNARVNDKNSDEIGELAQQFDSMADTLEQNFGVLRDLVQQNAELARRAEESAVRAERNRISRDLHDAIAQRLFSLSVSTSTLPDVIRRSQQQGIDQARTIAKLAEQTLLDLRQLLVELRPTNVIQRGLGDALQALCAEWENSHALRVECSVVLGDKYIPAGIEDTIYRVAQEALSNAIKHAESSAIHISLIRGQRQITLSVTDNGSGFDLENASQDGRFGLISMQERARAVGGTLAIESDTDQGTTVRLVIPLTPEVTNAGA